MNEADLADLLDDLTPSYDDRHGDWERVAAAARPARARYLPHLRVAALAVAIAAAALLVLAWPFHGDHGTVLDRALAAAGTGPVLHVVLRGEWGGTLVDVGTGVRTPVYGDTEVWFDTESGEEHSISRLGDVVQDEEVSKPEKPAAELAALGREYKQALEGGTARVTGEDTIDGEPVVWITIHSELLPDVADGKDHEWAQQVAVSKRTFKPVALRETRDGQPGPDTLQRVLELELVARNDGDFTASTPPLDGTAFKTGRRPISLDQAPGVLGRTPLWLGRAYGDAALTGVFRETTSAGHQERVRVTGQKAAAAIKCSEQRAGGGDCFRALGLSSVEVRPDGVFTLEGPIHWSDEQNGLVLVYGTLTLTEATHVSPFRRGAGSYVPPEGSVFLAAGGSTGFLQRDGIQIGVEAGSESAVLAAARALTPMEG